LKLCQNDCIFCFVKQMPPNQRPSLYIKDDDYRLSLIYGSFVTLSNVTNDDFERILREKISPIYVSVHTTDAKLRAKIMNNESASDIYNKLERLVNGGISVHVQIVLIPGINDEAELVKSVTDLEKLRPGIESIALVPVGLTSWRDRLVNLTPFDHSSARTVLDYAISYANTHRRKHGTSFLYVADEFFVLAQRDFPFASYYDNYPQLENGVGISRIFLDEFNKELASTNSPIRHNLVWITGESSHHLMQALQHKINSKLQGWVTLISVKNHFFGGNVTVSGLLGGRDIVAAVLESHLPDGATIMLPDILLRDNLFIDNLSIEDCQSQLKEFHIEVCPTNGIDLIKQSLR
ncbi:MAG: DUF512 domain-containing protein, partial [bacterium]|nr:DUF512 domain-containing protein [bacterium]